MSGMVEYLLAKAGGLLWSRGANGRLAVLIYHRVLPVPDPLRPWDVDHTRFNRQMRLLKDRFNVLPLHEGVQRLREGTLPPLAVSITFDDGYRDNHAQALPILARHDLPATFFIATGYLDGGCMWNDRVIEAVRREDDVLDLEEAGLGCHAVKSLAEKLRAIESLLPKLKYLPFAVRDDISRRLAKKAGVTDTADIMMSSGQVRALRAAGMAIGAHTARHPILANQTLAEARQDIEESKRFLEDLLQEPVEAFAYPNGRPGKDYQPEHIEFLKQAGFRYAVSTAWGIADREADSFQLPRLLPWDRSMAGFQARLLRALWDARAERV
jgi:peptidoglycan/xylan/chitin deacetylase (PgdA/CDA1 family)